jgi:putative ABC transport system permease protein
MLFKVAWLSLMNRKMSAFLTVFSIAISVFVLLSVEHIRSETKASFGRTVSGVDLIVGARTGQLNLLLYSVFRIGNPSNNISWESYQTIAKTKGVAWSVPLSMGDSHKGFNVIGTTEEYFEYFKFANKRPLSYSKGRTFKQNQEVVLGSSVAEKLGYSIDDSITLSHGTGKVSFSHHDDHPFVVVGILNATGTPVDQSLHVDLRAIDAIHKSPTKNMSFNRAVVAKPEIHSHSNDDDNHHHHNHQENDTLSVAQPSTVSAFLLGLESKITILRLQRVINQFKQEPLMAIMPGVALGELWQVMGFVESTLLVIAILVLISTLLGLCTMLLASMRERQRELAIVRAIGGHPSFVFLLVMLEVLLLTLLGIFSAFAMLWLTLMFGQNYIIDEFGLLISQNFLNYRTFVWVLVILSASLLVALLPSITAYRSSLNSGLTVHR